MKFPTAVLSAGHRLPNFYLETDIYLYIYRKGGGYVAKMVVNGVYSPKASPNASLRAGRTRRSAFFDPELAAFSKRSVSRRGGGLANGANNGVENGFW